MKRAKTVGVILHRAEVFTGRDYHFLIGRDGTITSMVGQDDVGEHAVYYNRTTVAIAIFGDFASAEKGLNFYPTSAQLRACIGLVCRMQVRYGPLWVAGHSELGLKGTRFASKLMPGHTCPGENFPVQYIIDKTAALSFPEQVASVRIS